MEPLAVLLADDHPVFREGLARVVSADRRLRVAGEASDGDEALRFVRTHGPALALVDLKLPVLDGIAVAQTVARERLATRVVILSAYDDDALVYRALEAGAAGYLTKEARREEIVEALARVADGQTVLAPALAGGLVSEIRQRGRPHGPRLTEREQQVLTMLCEGKSAPQIARELVVSPTTVKTHLAHLYDKLDVSDRAAAVAEAMRRGLVS